MVEKGCEQLGEYGTTLMVWWRLGLSPGRNWLPEGWLLDETSSASGDLLRRVRLGWEFVGTEWAANRDPDGGTLAGAGS